MNNSCPYSCGFKSNLGYCQVTACMNQEHNSSGTYYYEINDVTKEDYDEKYKDDKDYGRGIYA